MKGGEFPAENALLLQESTSSGCQSLCLRTARLLSPLLDCPLKSRVPFRVRLRRDNNPPGAKWPFSLRVSSMNPWGPGTLQRAPEVQTTFIQHQDFTGAPRSCSPGRPVELLAAVQPQPPHRGGADAATEPSGSTQPGITRTPTNVKRNNVLQNMQLFFMKSALVRVLVLPRPVTGIAGPVSGPP